MNASSVTVLSVEFLFAFVEARAKVSPLAYFRPADTARLPCPRPRSLGWTSEGGSNGMATTKQAFKNKAPDREGG